MTVEGDDGKEGDVLPRCFFDVEIGGIPIGRVVFELFANQCPKTAENFRLLCTGEGGEGKTTGKALHYKGTVFHRVIKSFMIQGGDFSNNNGTGGESIYGGTFEDENLQLKHDKPFLLSMANRGPNTNGSQFFILTDPAPHLNGVHVVFGRVVSGQPIIKQIEGLPVDRKSRPLSDVRVTNCGELILLKKKKEKKPKKEKKQRKKSASDEEEEGEKSPGEISDDSDTEKKHKKKKTSESEDLDDNKEVQHPLASVRNIDPDEIPKDPVSRFLTRQQRPAENDDKKVEERGKRRRSKSRSRSRDRDRGGREDRSRFNSRNTDNEGRKIKGRGRICFPRFTSRSRSKTPPHWKAETRKTISMKEFEEREKYKREREDELRRRQDERKKRHEGSFKQRPELERDTETKDKEQERERDPHERGDTSHQRYFRRYQERRESDLGESVVHLKDRFQSSTTDEFSTKNKDPEPESPDDDVEVDPPTKIHEQVVETGQAAAAGDGVVYYQHLFKPGSSAGETISNAAAKKDFREGFGLPDYMSKEKEDVSLKPRDGDEEEEEEEDELPPGEDDENVLAELRMRRDLLKKRLKDWEESSDEGDGGEDRETRDKGLQNAVQAELRALSQRDDLNVSESIVPADGKSEERRRSRSHSKPKTKSPSKSRSKSKSRSRSRDRRRDRDRKRRHSSRSRSRSRNRRRRSSSRDKRSRSRDRRRRTRRSRSRSRSRGHRRR